MNIIGQNGNEGEHYDIEVKDSEELKSKEEFFKELDKIEKSKSKQPKILKVLDKTSRQAKVLFDDGRTVWVGINSIEDLDDENKIKYL